MVNKPLVMIVNKNVTEAVAVSQLSKAHNPLAKGPSFKTVLRKEGSGSCEALLCLGMDGGFLPCGGTSLRQAGKSLACNLGDLSVNPADSLGTVLTIIDTQCLTPEPLILRGRIEFIC